MRHNGWGWGESGGARTQLCSARNSATPPLRSRSSSRHAVLVLTARCSLFCLCISHISVYHHMPSRSPLLATVPSAVQLGMRQARLDTFVCRRPSNAGGGGSAAGSDAAVRKRKLPPPDRCGRLRPGRQPSHQPRCPRVGLAAGADSCLTRRSAGTAARRMRRLGSRAAGAATSGGCTLMRTPRRQQWQRRKREWVRCHHHRAQHRQ